MLSNIANLPVNPRPKHAYSRTESSNLNARHLEKPFTDAAISGCLNLSAKKLKEFPSDANLFDLRDTTEADLSKNQFQELPRDVCNLNFLEVLDLSENLIKFVPHCVTQLGYLVELNLSRNHLASFPIEICSLTSLQILLINNNHIKRIPDDIDQLQNLECFDISSNELSHLSQEIGNIPSLQCLRLQRNHLEKLPDTICDLNVVQLNISENLLTTIPIDLRKMKFLINFDVSGNPLQTPLAKYVFRGKNYIMKMLELEATQEYRERDNNFRSLRNFKSMKQALPGDSEIPKAEAQHSRAISQPVDMKSVQKLTNGECNDKESFTKPPIPKVENKKTLIPSRKPSVDNGLLKNDKNEQPDPKKTLSSSLSKKSEKEALSAPTKIATRQASQPGTSNEFKKQHDLIKTQRENRSVQIAAGRDVIQSSPVKQTLGSNAKNIEKVPNFTVRRKMEQVKEEHDKLEWLKKTIESVLNVTLPEDILGALADGVYLCHFANACKPGIISSGFHVPELGTLHLSAVKCRKNVEAFISACVKVGVPKDEILFAPSKLNCFSASYYSNVVAFLKSEPDIIRDIGGSKDEETEDRASLMSEVSEQDVGKVTKFFYENTYRFYAKTMGRNVDAGYDMHEINRVGMCYSPSFTDKLLANALLIAFFGSVIVACMNAMGVINLK